MLEKQLQEEGKNKEKKKTDDVMQCNVKNCSILCSTKQCIDSAKTLLLYLHEVHQFKSEIKHRRLSKLSRVERGVTEQREEL